MLEALHCFGAGAVPAAAGYAEQRAYDVNRAAEPSLRQLVENYAQEHGMEFLPKAGRRSEGLQVNVSSNYLHHELKTKV